MPNTKIKENSADTQTSNEKKLSYDDLVASIFRNKALPDSEENSESDGVEDGQEWEEEEEAAEADTESEQTKGDVPPSSTTDDEEEWEEDQAKSTQNAPVFNVNYISHRRQLEFPFH